MQNRSFFGSIPPVTLNLIIVNFIVWLAALTLPKIAGINLNYWLGLHYFAADDFNVVQLITYMFLHDTSGIEHIFFNMFSVVHHIHTHSHQGKILCHLLRVTRIILRCQRKHEQRGSLCTFRRHALRLLLDSLLEKERNRRWRILLLTN